MFGIELRDKLFSLGVSRFTSTEIRYLESWTAQYSVGKLFSTRGEEGEGEMINAIFVGILTNFQTKKKKKSIPLFHGRKKLYGNIRVIALRRDVN